MLISRLCLKRRRRRRIHSKTFNYFGIIGSVAHTKTDENENRWWRTFCGIVYIVFLFLPLSGVSSAFLHQRAKDGYNTFDDTSTIFPSHNSITSPKWNEPYFDTSVPNNVTALVGKSAYLSCKVRNLGNKTVSNYVLLTH